MNHLFRDSKRSLLRWFLRLACVQIISLILHANDHRPIKIAEPLSGHIHPSICMSKAGTLIVTFGRVNHRDLRILRSHDAGKTWSHPEPFQHTTTTTHYPGSLTALSDGRIVHCWNRWEGDSDEKEPRRVLFSTSSDEGVTWTAPQSLPYSPERRSVIRHPLVEITPSRWLCPLDVSSPLSAPRKAPTSAELAFDPPTLAPLGNPSKDSQTSNPKAGATNSFACQTASFSHLRSPALASEGKR